MFFTPSPISHCHLLSPISILHKHAPHLQIQVNLHHLTCHQFGSCPNLLSQSKIHTTYTMHLESYTEEQLQHFQTPKSCLSYLMTYARLNRSRLQCQLTWALGGRSLIHRQKGWAATLVWEGCWGGTHCVGRGAARALRIGARPKSTRAAAATSMHATLPIEGTTRLAGDGHYWRDPFHPTARPLGDEWRGVMVPIAPPFGDRANRRLRFVTVQTMVNKRGGQCFDVSLAITVFGLVFQQLPMLSML
jgi:hypothetical protein